MTNTHFIGTYIEALTANDKYILRIENGKFVSDIYFKNGLDFETMQISDAKIFYSLEDAKELKQFSL